MLDWLAQWQPAQLNLALAWVWITLGFLWGAFLGTRYHKEAWLGGYGSWRRRLYRLAHIAFFGLGLINLAFFFTVRALALSSTPIAVASWAFAVGMVTMPACCVLAAHAPRWRVLFALPVGSLILAGALTVWGLW